MNKVEILTEKEENREDSFWYYDQEIARVQFPNGKKLYVESRGGIRIKFEEEGTFYKGDQAVDMARELDLTDDKLNALSDKFDAWDMNNWFAIVEVNTLGDTITDDLALAGDYDEAIEMLKACAKEKEKEYYS